jgi:hypothetical protein
MKNRRMLKSAYTMSADLSQEDKTKLHAIAVKYNLDSLAAAARYCIRHTAKRLTPEDLKAVVDDGTQ